MESKQLTAEQKKARTDRRKAKRDKDRKGAKEHFTANQSKFKDIQKGISDLGLQGFAKKGYKVYQGKHRIAGKRKVGGSDFQLAHVSQERVSTKYGMSIIAPELRLEARIPTLFA